jgi:hypothetical protein
MIVLAGMVLGAVLGVMQARRRGGSRLDMLHHAAAFAIAFAILGMFLTILIGRTAS